MSNTDNLHYTWLEVDETPLISHLLTLVDECLPLWPSSVLVSRREKDHNNRATFHVLGCATTCMHVSYVVCLLL